MAFSFLFPIPVFNAGTYQGTISARNLYDCIDQCRSKFCQFKGSIFPRSDMFVILVCLIYVAFKPQGMSLEFQQGISLFKTIGVPTFLFDFYLLFPKSNIFRMSSSVSLEFRFLNNPIFSLAEKYITIGRLTNSLFSVRQYFEANRSDNLWKTDSTFNSDVHKYEMVNNFFVSGGSYWYASQSKEFRENYSNLFSFMLDFRIKRSTNPIGNILDYINFNQFNNVKFNYLISPLSLISVQTKELVEWYFNGNHVISKTSAPKPPSFSPRHTSIQSVKTPLPKTAPAPATTPAYQAPNVDASASAKIKVPPLSSFSNEIQLVLSFLKQVIRLLESNQHVLVPS